MSSPNDYHQCDSCLNPVGLCCGGLRVVERVHLCDLCEKLPGARKLHPAAWSGTGLRPECSPADVMRLMIQLTHEILARR